MVLLSQMMRTAAFTGRTDVSMFTRIADRQGGAWAQRTVGAAYAPRPRRPPARPPAELLQEATALHEGGVLTDAEFQRLRGRLGV